MAERQRLSTAHLLQLDPAIARPAYDRALARTGILHLGLGAFHRAHQAAFTEDCLNAGEREWAIAAASLRSPATRDALAPQDGLYTLALRSSEGEALRVIGAIRDIFVAPENPAALLAAMTAPEVRIVSLTITEKGYGLDVATGALREDADLAHDLAHPLAPRTALGFLTEALARRRAEGTKPFTLLSCDNLSHNGRLLHGALCQFARARDPGLADFIEGEVACPSTMVDRIVPATTDADRDAISRRLGVEDAWPVVAEPFFQWVVEDRFPLGRPGWERSGVEFAADVGPYEVMKLRLLNGAHTTLAAMGRLAGFGTVAEAMADPTLRAFVGLYWSQVARTVPPPIDASAYTARLAARFDNRSLHHRLEQIASDASQKVPPRILAPLRELLVEGAPCSAPVFSIAAWMRSCEGADDAGRPLAMPDPVLAAWEGRPTAELSPETVVARWLAHAPVFGSDAAAKAALAPGLTAALSAIREKGVLAAARAVLAG